jgi:hypothetical protein
LTAEIVHMNRRGGPEGVIDAVEARAPDGFSNIDDVLSLSNARRSRAATRPPPATPASKSTRRRDNPI